MKPPVLLRCFSDSVLDDFVNLFSVSSVIACGIFVIKPSEIDLIPSCCQVSVVGEDNDR